MHLGFFGRRLLRKTRGLWIQGLWWLRIWNPLLRSLPTTSLLQPLSRSPYALKLTRLRSSHILIYLVYLTAILYAPVSSVLSRNVFFYRKRLLNLIKLLSQKIFRCLRLSGSDCNGHISFKFYSSSLYDCFIIVSESQILIKE